MEYALVGPENQIKEYSTRVDPSTRRMRPGWRWLPVEITFPDVSTNAPVREGPVISVLTDKVTKVWTVRDFTPEEKAERREREVAGSFDSNNANILKAAALVLLDESNRHAQAFNSLASAIANAGSLAALKTAVAAITFPSQRTAAQLRTAIRSKLDE